MALHPDTMSKLVVLPKNNILKSNSLIWKASLTSNTNQIFHLWSLEVIPMSILFPIVYVFDNLQPGSHHHHCHKKLHWCVPYVHPCYKTCLKSFSTYFVINLFLKSFNVRFKVFLYKMVTKPLWWKFCEKKFRICSQFVSDANIKKTRTTG